MSYRDLVVVVTPFGEPNALVTVATERAGGLGVLDLGRDPVAAKAALDDVSAWWSGTFGVRIGPNCSIAPADLPATVDTVVLATDFAEIARWQAPGRRIVVEVVSLAEARAVAPRVDGLIVRGNEAGGRVGTDASFVLVQQLAADPDVAVPFWVAGGIGEHTAAAAVAGGARGVVLDEHVALVREMELPSDVAAAIRAMDGSETVVRAGHRVYTRPDLPVLHDVSESLGARSLRTDLLPIGQVAVAGELAQRFGTAGGVVAAIRSAIESGLETAARLRPLAAGSRFATEHGIDVPIAQGPMTHVSDRADFAVAVAAGGGLPFLALSLSTADKSRALLTETAALIGDKPWGVGILGFVPPEVRAGQLAAILAVRPTFALIAGGRPAQAKELESAGIATFLHVPSPGLLDQFLAQGSRRFVFEGRECGGHVGPRSSFALWQAQVDRLLACGATRGDDFFGELHVLFAGGIHDERSAAMVAALAAPLAARGAGVGVLVGTAYLFTTEAVETGAITPTFQQAAVACERTELLETSPGHSTRCAYTPYVDTFRGTKARLQDEGVAAQQMWAELEQLNLGRLRIASKGLRRVGDEIRSVDESVQYDDGMVMIGDVATLRHDITSIAAVHEQISAGGTEFVTARAADLGIAGAAAAAADPIDIAIVGMACVFPEAADAAQYWSNIIAGVDAITEVPRDRWDSEIYYDPAAGEHAAGRRTPSKWGGFLPDVPFDALAHGIPPASLIGIEPMQLLALDAAAQALRDAGYGERTFDRTRTSVVFGAEAGADLGTSYGFRSVFESYFGELPPELDAHLPALTEDSFPGVLANVIAGRIANRLDLGGANFTVDAACAASLAAVDVACNQLRSGGSDMVLCGAVDTHNGIYDYLLFGAVHALSARGRCATFDAEADGITLGEGVGCVALKRLADAERDGDRIYAVIKGIAGSSDGRSLGLTAPRSSGQRLAMQRAYTMAGVTPAQVGLVEAHGTGTAVGDRTELKALTEVYTDAGAGVGTVALGSVKSQIGHTKCAAGLAALIKTARAVYTGVRPPTGNLKSPTAFWDPTTSPFYFDVTARPWSAAPGERYAGLSAFGFGGANFHAVIAGYGGAPEPRHGLDEWPAELILVRGADDAAAVREVDRLSRLLTTNDSAGRPWRLRDIARTMSTPPGAPIRIALVAPDLDGLAALLPAARAFEHDPARGIHVADPERPLGKVGFLFPGQGSQRVGMLADVFIAFPRLHGVLSDGAEWTADLYPPAAFDGTERSRQRARIDDTRVAQPVLGIAGLAMFETMSALGLRPDAVAGHSYGELVALSAAGALSKRELLRLSAVRGEAIHAAATSAGDAGAMIAVGAAPTVLAAVLAADDRCATVVVANNNAPGQTVLSGPTPAIAAASELLAAAGITATRLNTSCAFHSPVVAAAQVRLAAELADTSVTTPRVPVWSNTFAAPYPGEPEQIRDVLARQVAEPVRFAEQVAAMYDAGVRTFVEVGPGRVLTGLVGKILGSKVHRAIATDVPGEAGIPRLLAALAELAVAGAALTPDALYTGRDAKLVAADSVPRRAGWILNGHLVRTADGQYLPGGLRPARAFVRTPLPGATPPQDTRRDEIVLEYLRTSREVLAAQRDVMLGFLGTTPVIVDAAPAPLVAVPPVTVETPAAAPAPTPVGVALTAELALAAIRSIVSERTGYPEEMLEEDLDLEADLSIDSIKRIEIFGALNERIGALGAESGGVDESAMEQLVGFKTLRGIVEWLMHRAAGASAAPDTTASPAVSDATVPTRCERYVPVLDTAPFVAVPAEISYAGRCFVILGDGLGAGTELASLLAEHGADVRIEAPLGDPANIGTVDGVVHLGALTPGTGAVLPDGFATLRDAVVGSVQQLLVVTNLGGTLGRTEIESAGDVGLHGLVRTIAREYPAKTVRAVDVDPKERPDRIAAYLFAELQARPGAEPVVGYRDGERTALRVDVAPLSADGEPSAEQLGLDADSVVVLTGGARGVTARVAIGLARATGCRVELFGRTPAPSGAESDSTATASDRPALRRALIGQGLQKPSEIEAAVERIVADREIRSTMAELGKHAAEVRYHTVDVRDADAVRAAVTDIVARHGRIDGVVHGAGVLEDKLIVDKSPESFARVFQTKVDGAHLLVDVLPEDVRFVVLFGSVAGVWGNRGQVDYAAANDALDVLAHRWAERFAGRVVSVDWGPWAAAEGGMVSPALEAEYARRGIGVIDHDEGVACLLRELAFGSGAQVIYLDGSPTAFGADSASPDE